MRILTVCLGNICRSPAAEAALREAFTAAGLGDRVEVDSAGTGDWNVGQPPDPRMVAAARAADLQLGGCARQIGPADFAWADLLLVMDRGNLRDVLALAPDEAARGKVRLLAEFDDDAAAAEIPDPYFGDEAGFTDVVNAVRSAARGVVRHVRQRLGPSAG